MWRKRLSAGLDTGKVLQSSLLYPAVATLNLSNIRIPSVLNLTKNWNIGNIIMESCRLLSVSSMNCSAPPLRMMVQEVDLGLSSKVSQDLRVMSFISWTVDVIAPPDAFIVLFRSSS